MAKTTKAFSDDELQLKKRARRRLVGAIALVLAVVVFLPMILDNEPKPLSEDIAINIPPIPQPDAGEPLPAPEPEPSPPPVAEPPASAPAPKTETQAPSVRPAPTQPAVREGYVVQLGAFSNPANARQLLEKLRENRFSAYTEVVRTPNGERTRVRVGPFPSRDAAEQSRERLRARKLVIGEATIVQLGD